MSKIIFTLILLVNIASGSEIRIIFAGVIIPEAYDQNVTEYPGFKSCKRQLSCQVYPTWDWLTKGNSISNPNIDKLIVQYKCVKPIIDKYQDIAAKAEAGKGGVLDSQKDYKLDRTGERYLLLSCNGG